MSGYAVDTNIISFMLRGDRYLQEKVYLEANSGAGVVIPPIKTRGRFYCHAQVTNLLSVLLQSADCAT